MLSSLLNANLRMAIRRLWFRHEVRSAALKRVETATPALKLDGTPKMRGKKQMMTRRYRCEGCGNEGLKASEVAVDHKTGYEVGYTPGGRNSPVWWTWDILIKRMLDVKIGWLQVLCHPCHHTKTQRDRESLANWSFLDNMAEDSHGYKEYQQHKSEKKRSR